MGKLLKILYIVFAFIFFVYLLLPSPDYPNPPSDALQSDEPGDTEDINRRAYFTDYTREEVQEHYRIQLSQGFPQFITYKLIYPPEDAFGLIRDQTRSTHLVEFVHPMRESFYINEFVAQREKDTILINDKIWVQKITVKYVQSSLIVRLIVYVLTIILIPLAYNVFIFNFKRITKSKK